MTISRPAFGQKRCKIDSKIYEDMNENLMDPIVKDIARKGTYNELFPVAMDSTICNAPNTRLTYEEFNHIKYTKIKKSLLRFRASTICDVTHDFILTSKIVESKVDEITLANEHLENLNRRFDLDNFVFMGDRFYHSTALMYNIKEKNAHFLIRLQSNDFINERKWMTSNDEYIDISLTNPRIKKLPEELKQKAKEEGYMTIRITLIKLKDKNNKETTEIIASNLPMDKITPQDIKILYNKRWKIETNYNRLKNIIVIENFTGHRKIIIEQDFYSDIILFNLLICMKHDINKKIKKDDYKRKRKYRNKANLNLLYGKIKREIFNLFSKCSAEKVESI